MILFIKRNRLFLFVLALLTLVISTIAFEDDVSPDFAVQRRHRLVLHSGKSGDEVVADDKMKAKEEQKVHENERQEGLNEQNKRILKIMKSPSYRGDLNPRGTMIIQTGEGSTVIYMNAKGMDPMCVSETIGESAMEPSALSTAKVRSLNSPPYATNKTTPPTKVTRFDITPSTKTKSSKSMIDSTSTKFMAATASTPPTKESSKSTAGSTTTKPSAVTKSSPPTKIISGLDKTPSTATKSSKSTAKPSKSVPDETCPTGCSYVCEPVTLVKTSKAKFSKTASNVTTLDVSTNKEMSSIEGSCLCGYCMDCSSLTLFEQAYCNDSCMFVKGAPKPSVLFFELDTKSSLATGVNDNITVSFQAHKGGQAGCITTASKNLTTGLYRVAKPIECQDESGVGLEISVDYTGDGLRDFVLHTSCSNEIYLGMAIENSPFILEGYCSDHDNDENGGSCSHIRSDVGVNSCGSLSTSGSVRKLTLTNAPSHQPKEVRHMKVNATNNPSESSSSKSSKAKSSKSSTTNCTYTSKSSKSKSVKRMKANATNNLSDSSASKSSKSSDIVCSCGCQCDSSNLKSSLMPTSKPQTPPLISDSTSKPTSTKPSSTKPSFVPKPTTSKPTKAPIPPLEFESTLPPTSRPSSKPSFIKPLPTPLRSDLTSAPISRPSSTKRTEIASSSKSPTSQIAADPTTLRPTTAGSSTTPTSSPGQTLTTTPTVNPGQSSSTTPTNKQISSSSSPTISAGPTVSTAPSISVEHSISSTPVSNEPTSRPISSSAPSVTYVPSVPSVSSQPSSTALPVSSVPTSSPTSQPSSFKPSSFSTSQPSQSSIPPTSSLITPTKPSACLIRTPFDDGTRKPWGECDAERPFDPLSNLTTYSAAGCGPQSRGEHSALFDTSDSGPCPFGWRLVRQQIPVNCDFAAVFCGCQFWSYRVFECLPHNNSQRGRRDTVIGPLKETYPDGPQGDYLQLRNRPQPDLNQSSDQDREYLDERLGSKSCAVLVSSGSCSLPTQDGIVVGTTAETNYTVREHSFFQNEFDGVVLLIHDHGGTVIGCGSLE